MRLIKTIGTGRYVAKVYYDSEWQDNIVRFFVDGKHQKRADAHFHDDREDAINTATHWVAKQLSVIRKPKANAIKPSRKSTVKTYAAKVAALLKKPAAAKKKFVRKTTPKAKEPSLKYSIFQDSPKYHDQFICIAANATIAKAMCKFMNEHAAPGVRFKIKNR